MKFYFGGDSHVHGNGSPDTGGFRMVFDAVFASSGHTYEIVGPILFPTPVSWNSRNHGIGGTSIVDHNAGGSADTGAWLAIGSNTADVFIFELGTNPQNDFDSDAVVASRKADMRSLCEYVHGLRPNAFIIFMGLPLGQGNAARDARCVLVNEAFQVLGIELASEWTTGGVAFVPGMIGSTVHPDELTYGNIGRNLVHDVLRLLGMSGMLRMHFRR